MDKTEAEICDELYDGPITAGEVSKKLSIRIGDAEGYLEAMRLAGLVRVFGRLAKDSCGRSAVIYEAARTRRSLSPVAPPLRPGVPGRCG